MKSLTIQQQQAINHLNEWRVGALFMEPGTGKTRAAMTLINATPCTECFWVGPLRFKQLSGLAELFKDREYSKTTNDE